MSSTIKKLIILQSPARPSLTPTHLPQNPTHENPQPKTSYLTCNSLSVFTLFAQLMFIPDRIFTLRDVSCRLPFSSHQLYIRLSLCVHSDVPHFGVILRLQSRKRLYENQNADTCDVKRLAARLSIRRNEHLPRRTRQSFG